jgi:hypothetical protein
MFWEMLTTFVNGAAAIKESNASIRAATYNQNINRYNAAQTREAGKIEESRVRREVRQRIGYIRANAGASGFTEGSFDDVIASSMYEGEMDALITRYNYNAKADSYEMQGSMYGAAAQDARGGRALSAASTLLRGATSMYRNSGEYGAGDTPFRLGGGSGGGF